jgi:hypothetical protein
MSRPVLYLAVSLDVEEEGLFGGRYARRGFSTANTASLARLAPLCERGIRPTLFCAHSVLADTASRHALAHMRDRYGAEIGAHLHHWNTPPLTFEGPVADAALADNASSVPAADVPALLMAAKLESLMAVGSEFQSAPLTSFRMGRWDLHKNLWPLLAQAGIRVDASVRPLHCGVTPLAGPDHFDAPCNPYWVSVGKERIFEVPLSVTPLVRPLPGLVRRAAPGLRPGFKNWGALSLLPVYHPLWAMQAVTRLFAARGGQVLSLTWHSSEMMPGGAPHLPDAASVDRLMNKILAWTDWLTSRWEVRSLTMDQLREALGPQAPDSTELLCGRAAGCGDWTYPPPEAP